MTRLGKLDPVTLLALPAVAYLGLVYGLPLVGLLARSLMVEGTLSLASYTRFLSDPFSWTVIGNTLRVAAGVTLLCLFIGYRPRWRSPAPKGRRRRSFWWPSSFPSPWVWW